MILILALLAQTFEAKIYKPGTTVPVTTKAFVQTCSSIAVPVTAGEMINPTRIIYEEFDKPGLVCAVPDASAVISALPKSGAGTIYEGAVTRCVDGNCIESSRTTFCVGVPTQYQSQPSCEAAIKAAQDAGALYWFFCTFLRLCK